MTAAGWTSLAGSLVDVVTLGCKRMQDRGSRKTGEVVEFMGMMTDVSDRKRAEESLRRSEAYLVEAQRLTHTGSWVYSPATGETLYWSEEMFRIFGLDSEGDISVAREAPEIVHPEDFGRMSETARAGFREKAEFSQDFRLRLRDSTVKHLHVIWHPVLDEDGNLAHYIGTAADVTERKRAEEALRRSEAYLAEAQRLTHTGSWAYRAGGDALYWSEENFRIWGLNPEECVPDLEALYSRIHPDDRDKASEYGKQAVQARADYTQEFRVVLPDGSVRHIQSVGHPVVGASGELVEIVGTHLDVTDRKRAEEERERLRRLEEELAYINRVSMMGELAVSLSHELKQPIAAAITNANTCLRWLRRDPPEVDEACEAVIRIVHDCSRAAEIIDRLRSFFQKGAPAARDLVDVNEVAREMLVLMRSEADRYSISMRTYLAPELHRVTADRVQLQQVFLNLMMNGIEAMRDSGGELTIRSLQDSGGSIRVSVSDEGRGLPHGKGDKIFDAFFTTKPHGSGMGLAISRSIIESHGGRLWATANSGLGTTLYFSLPPARNECA